MGFKPFGDDFTNTVLHYWAFHGHQMWNFANHNTANDYFRKWGAFSIWLSKSYNSI
jgi:hypothetical protein